MWDEEQLQLDLFLGAAAADQDLPSSDLHGSRFVVDFRADYILVAGIYCRGFEVAEGLL